MHVTVMTLELSDSWLDIENDINEQLKAMKKFKVKAVQVFFHDGKLHLLISHKKRYKYLLDI